MVKDSNIDIDKNQEFKGFVDLKSILGIVSPILISLITEFFFNRIIGLKNISFPFFRIALIISIIVIVYSFVEIFIRAYKYRKYRNKKLTFIHPFLILIAAYFIFLFFNLNEKIILKSYGDDKSIEEVDKVDLLIYNEKDTVATERLNVKLIKKRISKNEQYDELYKYQLEGDVKYYQINKGFKEGNSFKLKIQSSDTTMLEVDSSYIDMKNKIVFIQPRFKSIPTFEEDSDCFNVLLLPFGLKQGDKNSVFELEDEIVERINSSSKKENMKVRAKFANNVFAEKELLSDSALESFSRKNHVDLIVWGNIYANKKDVPDDILLNYFYSGKDPIPFNSFNSQFYQFNSISEIKKGTLLFESDYILNWIFYLQQVDKSRNLMYSFYDSLDLFIKNGQNSRILTENEGEVLSNFMKNSINPIEENAISYLKKISLKSVSNKELYLNEILNAFCRNSMEKEFVEAFFVALKEGVLDLENLGPNAFVIFSNMSDSLLSYYVDRIVDFPVMRKYHIDIARSFSYGSITAENVVNRHLYIASCMDSSNCDYLEIAAYFYGHVRRNDVFARKYYSKLINYNNKNPGTYLMYGLYFKNINVLDSARYYLQKAIEIDPKHIDANLALLTIDYYNEFNNIEYIEKELKRLNSIDSLKVETRLFLSKVYAHSDFEKSYNGYLDVFKNWVVEWDEFGIENFYIFLITHLMLNKEDDLDNLVENVIEYCNNVGFSPLQLGILGTYFVTKKDFSRANYFFEQANNMLQTKISLVNLVYINMKLNRKLKAEKYLEKYICEFGKGEDFYSIYCFYLYNEGRFEESKMFLELAIEYNWIYKILDKDILEMDYVKNDLHLLMRVDSAAKSTLIKFNSNYKKLFLSSF